MSSSATPTLSAIYQSVRGQPHAGSDRILGLDPGETTGWCFFRGLELEDCGQLPTKPTIAVGGDRVRELLLEVRPYVVVMENYQIYAWKTQQHSFSDVHTLRLIGAIEYLCWLWPLVGGGDPEDIAIPIVKQTAQQAKGFCTDEKLKDWGLWQRGERHARDAIRHAVYYLLFNKEHARS